MSASVNSRIPGFKNLSVTDRRSAVAREAGLTADDLSVFEPDFGLGVEQADHMVENVLGVLGVPVGVATNFTINGRDRLVPMATEEPSVVAAASNARSNGPGARGFSYLQHRFDHAGPGSAPRHRRS